MLCGSTLINSSWWCLKGNRIALIIGQGHFGLSDFRILVSRSQCPVHSPSRPTGYHAQASSHCTSSCTDPLRLFCFAGSSAKVYMFARQFAKVLRTYWPCVRPVLHPKRLCSRQPLRPFSLGHFRMKHAVPAQIAKVFMQRTGQCFPNKFLTGYEIKKPSYHYMEKNFLDKNGGFCIVYSPLVSIVYSF